MPKRRVPTEGSDALRNNPFAGLGGIADGLDEGPVPPEPPAPASASPEDDRVRFGSKIVLRRQKKGHAGKTVTYVEGLNLGPDALEGVAKSLRKSLGCGCHVEGDAVVVGGAQAPRIEAWLRKQGAEHIVLGN